MAAVIGVPCAMASVRSSHSSCGEPGARHVHLNGWIYPLSLYTLTVACSGDRKSAVDHIAL
nr:DUF3987 domain-containing protein [Pseudomonas cremoricolorata]